MSTDRPTPAPPGRLNLALSLCILGGAVGLMHLAGTATSPLLLAGEALAFGLLLLPNYALIHEAEHHIFHRNKRLNDGFGVVMGWFFPASFTFMRSCHIGHHTRNRSDCELFEQYYPDESRLLKTAKFYLLYIGGFWLATALTTLILILWPRLLRSQMVQVTRIRLECLGAIAMQGSLLLLTDATILSQLALYYGFGLAWSATNFVAHAHSPRHVLDGAHNLVLPRPFELFLLHFNWHLAHHQHPSVPWLYLPDFDDKSRVRPPYLRTFVAFWRGPVPCREPSPRRTQDGERQLYPAQVG